MLSNEDKALYSKTNDRLAIPYTLNPELIIKFLVWLTGYTPIRLYVECGASDDSMIVNLLDYAQKKCDEYEKKFFLSDVNSINIV